MHTENKAPYWRLSTYYFVYFASIGALIPYWGLYLQQRGFNAAEIGQLMAILAATKIIAPYIWGWVADHSGQRLSLIRWGSLVAIFCFAGVYIAHSLVMMAAVMLLFSFFWNAGLPQFEATTLNFLGQNSHRYSHVRLWGSIGFILMVLSLGPLLDYKGVTVLPHILLVLFFLIWLSTLHVPDNKSQSTEQLPKESVLRILRQTEVRVVLAACFLMQLSFGPFYAFFSIFLQEHDYSKSSVGMFWAIGVIAEIIVFLNMHRWLPKYGAKRLLAFCFAVTALRWCLVGEFVDYAWVVIATQLLHAFSFGMFHAVMMYLIYQYFSGNSQGRGQALYSSLSFGAGGALGSYIAGYTWELYGGPTAYLFAAVAAAIGLLLVLFGLRDKRTVSN